MSRTSRTSDYVRIALFVVPSLWVAAAHSADLRQVYDQAVVYDAEYSAAQFDLEAARQLSPLARSAFLPQLTLGAEAGISTLADDGEGPYNETALSLSLSQTLFNRANGKLLDQAEQNVMQAEAQYQALGQTLILRVATAYFDVLRAQVNLEFSQSELEAISRQLEQAERRFEVGLVPVTDVRSAQAQYDLATAQEIAATNQVSTAREALLLITGENPDELAVPADDLPLVPPEPANIDAWVDMAKDQNLELVIARLLNDSNNTQVDIERASRYPTLDLIGTAASSTTDLSSSSDTDVAEIKLQLQVPILTGGRIKSQVAQARALARSSDDLLLAQERATVQQTRDGYRGVEATISRVNALRQALVSTQKAAEATEAGFRAGTRTSVEVLQALRDTFSAQSDYAGARYDYIINSLSLKAAAGTLSENDIDSVNSFLSVAESE
ncbi:TolC family outer membrane protein [Granulosicoccus antarcticus]|uniref:Outer membrane protein TolC n=1 Tax=Granulosicoccus antarcticus IMCC3135 TaxID=1192854 RepID=A0A2Z2P2S6_9GAMM|nr:TolC family outer membrane protein [Granulosicoccus antarcticus]ASJ74024.1 Outer membrane protein TolC [Granulosicoccus antarcticus IMCC3135]